jgi:hypothetical protein
MTGVANFYFDGKPAELNRFVKLAVIAGVYSGKTVAKDIGRVERKSPKEFSIGYNYANGFIERRMN